MSWRMPAEGDVWSNERSSGTDQNYQEETGTKGSNLQRSHALRQGSFNLSLEAKFITLFKILFVFIK